MHKHKPFSHRLGYAIAITFAMACWFSVIALASLASRLF